MKKQKLLLALSLVMTLSLSTHAALDSRMWNSLFTTAPGLGGDVDGDGTGWWTEVYDITTSTSTGGNTDASQGWFTGFGYVLNDFAFGNSTEGDSVVLRLYNNADPLLATYRLDSAAITLADLTDPITPGSNDVTFDMSGSTWQAVPEPATFLLFGMGAMGAWLVRRNKLKAREEA